MHTASRKAEYSWTCTWCAAGMHTCEEKGKWVGMLPHSRERGFWWEFIRQNVTFLTEEECCKNLNIINTWLDSPDHSTLWSLIIVAPKCSGLVITPRKIPPTDDPFRLSAHHLECCEEKRIRGQAHLTSYACIQLTHCSLFRHGGYTQRETDERMVSSTWIAIYAWGSVLLAMTFSHSFMYTWTDQMDNA